MKEATSLTDSSGISPKCQEDLRKGKMKEAQGVIFNNLLLLGIVMFLTHYLIELLKKPS